MVLSPYLPSLAFFVEEFLDSEKQFDMPIGISLVFSPLLFVLL